MSARLNELEARGLISRRVEPGPRVRVSYRSPKKGGGFGQVAEAIVCDGRAGRARI